MVRIAQGLAGTHGLAVDLLTPRPRGGSADRLGPRVRPVTLRGGSTARSTPDLVRYVARRHPDVLISGQPHLNIAATARAPWPGGGRAWR